MFYFKDSTYLVARYGCCLGQQGADGGHTHLHTCTHVYTHTFTFTLKQHKKQGALSNPWSKPQLESHTQASGQHTVDSLGCRSKYTWNYIQSTDKREEASPSWGEEGKEDIWLAALWSSAHLLVSGAEGQGKSRRPLSNRGKRAEVFGQFLGKWVSYEVQERQETDCKLVRLTICASE